MKAIINIINFSTIFVINIVLWVDNLSVILTTSSSLMDFRGVIVNINPTPIKPSYIFLLRSLEAHYKDQFLCQNLYDVILAEIVIFS